MDSHQPTYPCPQCGVQFLSATDLRRHIYAIHYSRREDSPNPRLVSSVYLPRGCRECPICLRVFAGSDNVHERRGWTCPDCGRTYSRRERHSCVQ
eukprot:jgi/Tetstr1/463954/TSEL_008759.t1